MSLWESYILPNITSSTQKQNSRQLKGPGSDECQVLYVRDESLNFAEPSITLYVN